MRALQLQFFVNINHRYTRDRKILSKTELRVIQITALIYCISFVLNDLDTNQLRDTRNSASIELSEYSQEEVIDKSFFREFVRDFLDRTNDFCELEIYIVWF